MLLLAFFAFCTIGVLQFQISERDKEIETLKSQAKIQIFNQKLDIRFLTNQVLVQTQKVNDQEKELKLLKDQIIFLNTILRESKEFKRKGVDTMRWRGEAIWEMENSNVWSNENVDIKLKDNIKLRTWRETSKMANIKLRKWRKTSKTAMTPN